jgi:hypothetical protein
MGIIKSMPDVNSADRHQLHQVSGGRGHRRPDARGAPRVASYEGSKFYDDDGVFANYSQLRANPESANDTLEAPVIRELLGDVRGHDFLDLGCGQRRVRARVAGGGRRVVHRRRRLAEHGGEARRHCSRHRRTSSMRS